MRVFVKICGLCRSEDVEAVAGLKPDAMGFVFWRKSPRVVSPENVGEWTRDLPRSIRKVGVFVDAPLADVVRAIKAARLDVVQLHGHEPPGFCELIPTDVWKSLHLDRVDEETAGAYRVDAFLVDSYSAESPGGTGRTGDWTLARAFVKARRTPVLLAGGLTPGNVREAVRAVRPWGVDVSSGVESRPGKKDIGKVRDFIAQCRRR